MTQQLRALRLEGKVPLFLSIPSTPFSLGALRRLVGVEQEEHVSVIDSCSTKVT